MSEISIRELRANLAAHIREAESGEQVIILRDGAPAAALVPLSMVETFDAAEDELLAREARDRLAANEPTVTMAEVLADLFTEDPE
ncbi:type II toxin-antitoxin system Phd/YefM family antitoxin [Nocardia amikacinitolerans]|uniref:type II toxin-antitoxin system Phd/YefM family antitoxin n=1 Tax=Nocardia amikacinitolerans TaxID=756689 RepID=UPI0020A606CF|nr:type II toxin-antitoxin system Phd/YefM family antitoxin [Nocardia amikacinitolerans]MCP2276573.1 prevent-host-death family protein [Nocardia amikacinitolerans]